MNQVIRNTQQETNMNLHNTSQIGQPAPEELVPSRYALKVGEIDVLVVSDGVLPLPTKMLGHNAAPSVRAGWLKDMFLPPDAFDWALNAVVVRSIRPTWSVGLSSGRVTFVNRRQALAPRIAAASSSSFGMACRPARTTSAI